MSILQYLDQEYLRIQDHLAARVEDLPNLDLETIQDKDSLIRALVGQNKAYGNHIISLYKTIDSAKPLRSPKSSTKNSTDRSNVDLVTELQNKLKSYQNIIEDLSNKNLVLLTQVEQLTEHINYKEMKSDNRNVSLTSFSYNGNKFLNSGRVETNQTQRDISIDIDLLFNNEDFKRATELLTLMDYKQPTNVTTENFNELLIIANKIKDAEMNELLEKLRIVAEAIEIQEPGQKLQDESIGTNSSSPIDRLFTFIEQKLIKIWSLDQNPEGEELKKSILNSERRLMSFNTKRRQASLSVETEGDYLCTEQLKEKVRLLDRDLRQTELELQEKTDRVEELEARCAKEECLLQDLENEVKNRLIMEDRVQELADENEELKEACEVIDKERKELAERINILHDEIQSKNEDLNKFIEEREQLLQANENMKDLEKLREEFEERGDKIEALTNANALLREKQQEGENGKKSVIRCPKENLLVESALKMQETLLCNLKQVLISLKEHLVDTLRNTEEMVLSERIETLDESMDGGSNARSEIRRYIKWNNSSIQELLKQAYFIKSTAEFILEHSKERKNMKKLQEELNIKPFQYAEEADQEEEGVLKPINKNNPFKLQLKKDQKEISNKLKTAIQSLEDDNEFGSKFGSPIDAKNLFDTECDQKSTFIYEIVTLVNRGINKTNDAVSKIRKLADSKDAKSLISNISHQLEELQNQVNDFGSLHGIESSTKKTNEKILTQEKFVAVQKENLENQPKQRPSQRRLNINTGQEMTTGKIVNQNQNQGFLTPSNRLNIVQSALASPEKLDGKLFKSPPAVNEKNKNKEELQRRIHYLEIENKDLKEYKISSEAALKKTHKKLERLNLNFSSEVNAVQEEKRILMEEKEKLVLELEKKEEEIVMLAQRVTLLQSLSNEQLEMMKVKDQDLADLLDEKRDNQELVRELQVKLGEQVKGMEECSESATQRVNETNALQIELAEITRKYNDLEKKNKEILSLTKISTDTQEKMVQNKNEMEDKIKKLNELLQITRNELKTCRRLVEEKNTEIAQKEEDIRSLKEALKKGRNINKASDIVVHLKGEIQAQNMEISSLKNENSDLIQINDLLQNELEKVSNMNRSSVISKVDYRPPANTIRDGTEEMITLQKTLKMREEQQKLDRSASQKEVIASKRRGSEMAAEAKLHENESRRGSTVYTDLLQTTVGTFIPPHNMSQSQTSRSTTRDEREREAEIQMLTQRMNELTKSLRTNQMATHQTYPSFRFMHPDQS